MENTSDLGDLFGRYYKSCLRTAKSIVHNDEDAWDAVQSACCAAMQHYDTYRGEASFRTWLTRIVINQCLMRLRDRLRQAAPLDSERVALGHPYFASREMSAEEWARYRQMSAMILQKLPPRLRQAYMLHAVHEWSAQEIGDDLGITVAAVKSRLHRARKELRSSFARRASLVAQRSLYAGGNGRRSASMVGISSETVG
jgi:RNA polymerase sigma-70 factor, ECF subfamily